MSLPIDKKDKNAKPVEYTKEDIQKAERKLVEARVKLLFNHPFFGQLALRMGLHAAQDRWCPTAATDGRKMYYSPGFINKLDVQECAFVVAHELGHCIYEHMLRREGRDPKLWNIAGDYIINNMIDTEIVHGGGNACARIITTIKPFLDHKYDEWTTEEVYDDLMQQCQGGGDPSKDGELIDVHIDFDSGGGEDDEEGEGGAQEGLAGPPKPLTEEEKKALENEMRDAMIQAAQSVGADNVPGDMKRMIRDLIEPRLDWRELIRAQIESSLKSNYTWMRPNRKGWHMPAILPGMDRDVKIDVVLAIDTSGSISQEMLTDFVSEVAGIMEQYEDYRIRIWQFDTKRLWV